MPKLELIDPTGFIQGELQKTIDLVSFGLQAAENLRVNSLTIPGVLFHLTPARGNSMEVEEARAVFRAWIIGNGIRDCVDAIGPSLEWARKICFLWTREGQVSVNENGTLHFTGLIKGEEWNEQLVREGAEFEFWSLRRKLGFLNASYGLNLPATSDSILSISYARNCLTHRRGIVGIEDLRNNPNNKLVVHWKKMQLIAQGDEGPRVLDPPAQVNDGEQVSFGYADASREFEIGERIEFTPQEFVQLVSTFLLFALQIQGSIRALQEARRQI